MELEKTIEEEIIENVFDIRIINKSRVVVIGSNKKYNSIMVSHDYKTGKILMQEYHSLPED